MPDFLHVGCGQARKAHAAPGFRSDEWREIRFDINSDVAPDIIGTMTDMSAVASESVDAVYSSHNIEHLYAHDVPLALAEFRRVLRPDGFVVIACPDLQTVCELVAQDKLTEAAYTSPAGPIAPLDIIYGHRPQIAQGNFHMAHKCGFTHTVLIATLRAAGFASVASVRRQAHFDLLALATKQPWDDSRLKDMATLMLG